jgi:DNA modification methylase
VSEDELPPVLPFFSGTWYGAETVWLNGDKPAEKTEPVNLFEVMNCQACGTEMPTSQLFPFDDDDNEFFMCIDTESCYARVNGAKEDPTTHSFLFDAVNRLTERVEELEHWRAEMGAATAEVVGVLAQAPTTDLSDLTGDEWVNAVAPTWVQAMPDPDTRTHVMSRIGTVGTTLVRADARAVPMDDGTVDLIVTSPPYWAQRSYTDDGGSHYAGQIGDEPTYGEFIDNLVACTRDWVRVLKPSGSIWVNLGDKYSTSSSNESRISGASGKAQTARGAVPQVAGMKPKSLLGLPWRYALRCIDELGLILREEVIWSKPNGMPESVTDRCRRSHEQWFHFTKRPDYYSAVDRIRLQDTPGSHRRGANASVNPHRADVGPNSIIPTSPLGALPPSVWDIATAGLTVPEWLGVDHYAAYPMELPRRIIQGFAPLEVCTSCGEGRRPHKSVVREGGRIRQKVDQRFLGKPKPDGMSPMSQDAIGAHAGYKTWHSIAGDVCACTPYTDHEGVRVGVAARSGDALVPGNTPRSLGAPALGPWREYHIDEWEPPPSRPAVVLDPFGGTGTTVLVAETHGRHGVHLDLSLDYLKIARWRTTDPAQRASAMLVPKPPAQIDGQLSLLDALGANA